MKFTRVYLVCLVMCCMLLAGCTSMLPHRNDFRLTSIGDFSIVLIGLQTDHTIRINRGWDQSDGWYADRFQILTILKHANDGFIVLKVPSRDNGKNYGVLSLRPRGLLSQSYNVCGRKNTFTFEAPRGVVYIGDFFLSGIAEQSDDRKPVMQGIEKAQEFLAKHHPTLAPHLVQGTSRLQPIANVRCPRWYDYLYFPVI